MKKSFLKVIAAFVGLCLLVNLTTPLLKNTSLAWISLDSFSLRNNFYFAKGQWLADGRTLMAAVRFLYQSKGKDTQINFGALPFVPTNQQRLSAEISATDGPEPTILLQERRLSRLENLNIRQRRLFPFGPSPVFAVTSSSLNNQSDMPSMDCQIIVRHGPIGTKTAQVTALPTNVILPRLPTLPPSA